MINKVTLLGRVGGDPEIRDISSEVKVASFSLATNEKYRDQSGQWQEKTEWHRITVWRSLAQRTEQSIKKGMLVYLEGKIQTRKYTDANGVEKNATDIVGSYMKVVDRNNNQANSIGNFEQTAPAVNTQTETAQPAQKDDDDTGLPF